MGTISQLSAVDALAAGDQFPISDTSNGDDRRVSASAVATFVNAQETGNQAAFVKQVSAPSATGFTVAITDGSDNIWLVLTPSGTHADGAITLPAVANCVDGQEVLVNSTQVVSTFVVNANGASDVLGEPAALTANGYFRLKFESVLTTWYRVG